MGVTAKDNRLFVEAVLYRCRAGIPRFAGALWRSRSEFIGASPGEPWNKMFEMLALDADNEYAMIDSTIVHAHQHSCGRPKKTAKSHRSDAAEAN